MSVSLMCLFIFIFGTLILVFHRQVTAGKTLLSEERLFEMWIAIYIAGTSCFHFKLAFFPDYYRDY